MFRNCLQEHQHQSESKPGLAPDPVEFTWINGYFSAAILVLQKKNSLYFWREPFQRIGSSSVLVPFGETWKEFRGEEYLEEEASKPVKSVSQKREYLCRREGGGVAS